MKKQRISQKEIEHVAWLARIELSDNEKDLFTRQFNEILNYFERINEADTENVPPTYHVLDLLNVYRDDKVTNSLPLKAALKNAPRKEKQFLKAPRIV